MGLGDLVSNGLTGLENPSADDGDTASKTSNFASTAMKDFSNLHDTALLFSLVSCVPGAEKCLSACGLDQY